MKVNVRRSSGEMFHVLLGTNANADDTGDTGDTVSDTKPATLLDLKESIAQSQSDLSVDCQRLIYKGRILDNDNDLLSACGITHESTVHLVKATQKRATTTTQTTNATAERSRNVLHNTMIPRDTNTTEQIAPSLDLNSPMMQSMLDQHRPQDLLGTLMDQNPQMQALLQNNPELRQVMNDPNLLRQSLQLMRDPNAMRHAMRNQELAMSQIENMPGGFAALQSMYQQVQEPLMDAMTNNVNTTNTTNNPANQFAGAAGAAMPNPWGSPTSAVSTPTTANATNNNTGSNTTGTRWFPTTNSATTNANTLPMQQLEQTLQLLESNPMMQQMMNDVLSDPHTLQEIMQQHPELHQNNPLMANLMNNPQLMRQMMDPSNIRSMMQLQQSFNTMPMMPQQQPLPNSNPWSTASSTSTTTSTVPPLRMNQPLDFTNLLSNQLQSTHLQQPLRHMQALIDMGFEDNVNTRGALELANGNINRAVDILLENNTGSSGSAPDVPPPSNQNNEDPKDSAEKKND